MVAPVRFPSGVSIAAPWQFFASMGVPNPFFYHQFADDFDEPPTSNGWTVTGTGALAAGDGGIVTLTTAASALAFSEIQRTQPAFQPVAGKRLYFVARVSMSDIVNAAIIAGLMPVTATPFTNPANGVWISKAASSSQFVLNVANNSVVTSTNIPTSAYIGAFGNNTYLDVGIYITNGFGSNFTQGVTITASIAPSLVSYIPQSGTGATNSTNRAPNVISTAPLITTLQATPLAPVLAVQTGNSSALTASFDFVGAFRER